MNSSNRAGLLAYPTQHLIDDDIEEVCLNRTGGPADDLRESHLLVCPECLDKAERVLEQVHDLRTALRSYLERYGHDYVARLPLGEKLLQSNYLM